MGHGHQHFHQMMERQVTQRDVTTINGQVVSVVYVTESPSFNGVIGGYSTVTDGGDAQATAAASAAGDNTASGSANTDSIPDAATATGLATTSLSVIPSSSTAGSSSNTAVAGPAVTSSSDSSSSSSSSSSNDSEGMSTGAKAGLAIGIIAGIGLIAALLLWFIGKKKKEKKAQEGREAEDEKQTFGASRNAIGMQSAPFQSTGPAPRLSIRPMSKNLLGDFGFGGSNRRSAGNMLNTATDNSPRNVSPVPQSRAQTPPENPFADPQNPFADPEKGAAGPISGPAPRSAPPQIAPPVAPNPDRIAFTGSWPAAPAGYEPKQDAHPRDLPTDKPTGLRKAAPAPASVSEPDDLPIMGASTPQISMPSPSASSPSAAPSGFASAGAAAGTAAAGVAAGAAIGATAAAASSRKQESRPEPLRTQPQQPPREGPRQQPPRAEPRQQPREEPQESLREAPREAAPSPGPGPSPAFAAAAAASDPPSSPAPSATSSQASAQNGGNVYRVLMDFAPSMDDELELKSGQLVRLLHEYDDGWALCIKLDRSQQGVVPRTCLAAKPSKPKPSHLGQYARNAGPQGRPMSPAGDPRGRPMSPAGGRNSPAMNRPMSPGMGRPMSPGMGRPMSPAGGPMRPMSPGGRQMRPMSPAGGRGPRPQHGPPGGSRGSNRPMSPGGFNQAPRPLSPGPMRGPPKRSQSPGPYGAAGPLPMPSAPMRRRSNSASAFQERRMSPPGPSKLGPGQGIRPMSPAGMGMAI